MIVKIIGLLFLFSICMGNTYDQENDSISNKLTKELEQISANGTLVGFSVAIVNEDGTLYENGFGFADKKANKQYRQNTLQNIGSISKTVIGGGLVESARIR